MVTFNSVTTSSVPTFNGVTTSSSVPTFNSVITFSSGDITFSGPTPSPSSSAQNLTSSTVSSGGSSATSLSTPSTTGAASRSIALAPGKQIMALVAIVGLSIIRNIAHVL